MDNNIETHPKTYCMIKTSIILALAKTHLSAYETMIIFAIIRKTYGWVEEGGGRKTHDWISYSQLKELTGITQDSHISRTIKLLTEKNIVTKGGKKIGINKNVDSWLKLPKGVNTHHGKKLPKGVSEVTKGGNSKLPKGADTIETYTKETITKEIIPKGITGFGNPEINEVSSYFLKVFQIPKEDCSQKESRRYWYLLLNESKQGAFGVKWLIDVAHQDDYYKNNITSSKDLYYKRVKLLARKRGTSPKTAFFKEEL